MRTPNDSLDAHADDQDDEIDSNHAGEDEYNSINEAVHHHSLERLHTIKDSFKEKIVALAHEVIVFTTCRDLLQIYC